MNEHFPGSYDLAPDQDTLVSIVQAAGKVLKEKGIEGLENGRYQIDDSSAAANIFTCKLSPEIVHHIFSIPLETIRVSSDGHAEGCEIIYLPESMLEDGTQCSAELGLYVTEVVGRSGDLSPLHIEHSWSIRGWEGQCLEGEYKVEYSIDGRRVSPGNLDLESLDLRNSEDIRRLIADIRNNTQSLGVDDIDTIYRLIDKISQSGV
ncbi:hypothetical protein ACJ8XG_00385 [Candidatus Nanosynbacter lyticus]|uniref:hypothetical protein n=1 Tax=Candidatus Nanosynbacter lyticus TaxID=2093824 RepID=UPI0038D229C3